MIFLMNSLYVEFEDLGKSVRSRRISGGDVNQGGVDGNKGSNGLSLRCL